MVTTIKEHGAHDMFPRFMALAAGERGRLVRCSIQGQTHTKRCVGPLGRNGTRPGKYGTCGYSGCEQSAGSRLKSACPRHAQNPGPEASSDPYCVLQRTSDGVTPKRRRNSRLNVERSPKPAVKTISPMVRLA